MAGWMPRVLRRGLTAVILALTVLALAPSSPASAHAELVASTPSNGARLDKPPTRVTMTFTESVNLIDGGIRLVNSLGDPVSSPAPTVDGHTVSLPMPSGLRNGKYLVSWRVVSADGHPVQGAFSFGIGVDAQGVVGAGSNQPTTAPAPVVLIRFAGYLAFSLLVGVVAFVTWCSPSSRKDPTAHLLGRVALVAGLVTTAAGLMVEGPYVAAVGWSKMFDVDLLRQTAASPFGQALLWRLAIYGALFFAVWMLEWLEPVIARWLVGAGILALAVTFAASGHGAGSGRVLDFAVDTVHVLTAGIWVGGLAVLAIAGRSVERRAYQQFSTMAMVSVLALIASGVVNAVLRFDAVSQVWQTRYGQILIVKVVVVGLALAAAAASRHTLRQERTPGRTVRLEAVITVVVVAITAVLSLTTPPPTLAAQRGGTASTNSASAPDGTATMKLGQGRTAKLLVTPPTTAGSRLSLTLLDSQNRPLAANRVTLQVGLPARKVEGLQVPMRRTGDVWVGSFTFPVEGAWKATVTVEDKTLVAVVAVGDIQIGG